VKTGPTRVNKHQVLQRRPVLVLRKEHRIELPMAGDEVAALHRIEHKVWDENTKVFVE
jgi:hypothetical protein